MSTGDKARYLSSEDTNSLESGYAAWSKISEAQTNWIDKDLVLAGEGLTIEGYPDFGDGLDDSIPIAGWNGSSATPLVICAAPGHEVKGTLNQGFWIKPLTTTTHTFNVMDAGSSRGLHIHDVGLDLQNQTEGFPFIINIGGANPSDPAIFERNFIYKSAAPIFFEMYGCAIYFRNNMVVHGSTVDDGRVFYLRRMTGGNTFDYNTIILIENSVCFEFNSYGSSRVWRIRNNIIVGALNAITFPVAPDDGDNLTELDYNSITDDTLSAYPGVNNRINQTFSFVGGDDYHLLASDAGAQNHGLNLTDTGVFSFDNDIDLDVRDVTGPWDIGADELAGVAAVKPNPLFFAQDF